MSKCISRAGEYSEHETTEGNYICDLCGVLDEEGMFAELDRLRATVARVEALANGSDFWRATPCGCGHRADLHDAGDMGRKPMCSGGLGLCECDWSFWRIAQDRLRAALVDPERQP